MKIDSNASHAVKVLISLTKRKTSGARGLVPGMDLLTEE